MGNQLICHLQIWLMCYEICRLQHLDQIEIMTNPPAKYDASGNSGIINIKTKKGRTEGFNGSLTTGGTLSFYKRDNSLLAPVRTFKQFES